ncbi:MAG: sodium:solute symporter family protein, partial [Thermoplasmatota archaeon]
IGLALAYDPPASIFTIVTLAFTGLAILYPVTLSVLYFDVDPKACIISIITGLLMLVIYNYGLLPSFGFLPAMPIIAVSSSVLAVSNFIMKRIDFI